MIYEEIEQNKKIYSIKAESIGYFDLNQYKIDMVRVNGEMAYVYWYRLIDIKTNEEQLINGKYVMQVSFTN